ncbi:ABC transporter ATP-binding protein [Streptococcus caprae]|uniref:ABC transporter ATP-binding protein n=1 Tax=Streptococcus caprae TaxID=1640501 RepID=A0ABV8CVD8_9STRE
MSKQSKSLSRLLRQLFAQRFLVIFALIGTCLQVGLTVYLPVLIGRAVDSLLTAGFQAQLVAILGQMVLVILVNTLLQWINPLLTNRMVFGYIQQLRQAVLAKVHRLPLSYLDRQSVGDMVSRVTADSEQLSTGLIMVFNQFLTGILTILLTIVFMAKLDVLMLVMVLVLTPLSLLLARFIATKSYHFFKEQTQTRGAQTQLIEEMVSQESLLQAFNAQEEAIAAFSKSNEAYMTASQKAIFYSSTVPPTTRFINALIYGLLTGVGALRIMSGAFTVGELTTFLNYVTQYTKPFNDISSVLTELQSSLACAERLYAVLDQSDFAETGTAELSEDGLVGQIDFVSVGFGYEPDKPLIEDLSISIPAGAKVAIVGPTGAGKSTLINLLMRFYDLESGEIRLDGTPTTAYTRQSLRQQIGMVLQETWLKEASIHDNIAYGKPDATREEVVVAAKSANVDFFIRQLPNGYDTILKDNGSSLSQGQRQLLTIARIFLNIPKILILDEATSSIDTRTELLVQQAFEKLMVGRTSFIIAHRLSTIQTADLILVMVAGDIVEYGNHQELMAKKGVYYQMQMAQT